MTHLESWVVWCGSMSHSWGKNPYIRAPSGQEFGFFMQPSKLLSLLLVQFTIFISLPCFEDQSALSSDDPPCTISIRVLISRYKREVFVIFWEVTCCKYYQYESQIVTEYYILTRQRFEQRSLGTVNCRVNEKCEGLSDSNNSKKQLSSIQTWVQKATPNSRESPPYSIDPPGSRPSLWIYCMPPQALPPTPTPGRTFSYNW